MHEAKRGKGNLESKVRIKIMALNIGSFFSKKTALENYINDQEVNKIVLTEANVTQSRAGQIHLHNFS